MIECVITSLLWSKTTPSGTTASRTSVSPLSFPEWKRKSASGALGQNTPNAGTAMNAAPPQNSERTTSLREVQSKILHNFVANGVPASRRSPRKSRDNLPFWQITAFRYELERKQAAGIEGVKPGGQNRLAGVCRRSGRDSGSCRFGQFERPHNTTSITRWRRPTSRKPRKKN